MDVGGAVCLLAYICCPIHRSQRLCNFKNVNFEGFVVPSQSNQPYRSISGLENVSLLISYVAVETQIRSNAAFHGFS